MFKAEVGAKIAMLTSNGEYMMSAVDVYVSNKQNCTFISPLTVSENICILIRGEVQARKQGESSVSSLDAANV